MSLHIAHRFAILAIVSLLAAAAQAQADPATAYPVKSIPQIDVPCGEFVEQTPIESVDQ